MAISNKKIISYKLYEKNINGNKYLDFIKEIVNKYQNNYTLLMDNATIHKTKKFIKYCKTNKVNILYNIPYNPESNPIEMIFCPIKKFIKSNNTKSIIFINDSINEYITNINKDSLKKMFDKSLSI
jgi:transposase